MRISSKSWALPDQPPKLRSALLLLRLKAIKRLAASYVVRSKQVRRAFKTLITKEHPDKGGNPERFKLIKLAYDTLSDKRKVTFYCFAAIIPALLFQILSRLTTVCFS